MGFWIIAIGLALVCCAVLTRSALLGHPGEVSPATYDLQVYRDQLKEVDRDVARKVISPEDAERIRAEVSRRILAADARRQAEQTAEAGPGKSGLAVGAMAGLLVLGGTGLIYSQIGAPGYRDLPLAQRIAASDDARRSQRSQADAEQGLPPRPEVPASDEHLALVSQLRAAVAQRPGDTEGLVLLVRNEAGLGNFAAAYRAQAELITIRGSKATAEDYAILADLMVTAARGYVSSDAESALQAALARDPENARARYYLGLFMLQVDRPDATFKLWRDLLEESRPDDPWTPFILDRITDVALRAGVRYDLPVRPGLFADPTDDDIAAASQLSAQARIEMIRGMVASLSARLAAQGGTSEEWSRLIRAYGVLGDTDRAKAIFEEALQVFSRDPAAIMLLTSAGRSAGVAE